MNGSAFLSLILFTSPNGSWDDINVPYVTGIHQKINAVLSRVCHIDTYNIIAKLSPNEIDLQLNLSYILGRGTENSDSLSRFLDKQ